MIAPVVIFVYNRPNHTIQTIESLAINYLAKETDLFIFSDAAKDEKSIEKVKLVRDYIDKLADRKLFKTINIIKAKSNKGLANSVISGVSEIVELYGKVIVLEDDLKSSKDFLQYMNDALDYYQRDGKIWSISGYTFKINVPQYYKSQVYITYRGCSWGWATWKDRWENVDWNVSDYDKFKGDLNLRKKMNRGGRDMSTMLDWQMQGKIDSWAIRWCYTQSKLNMFTVYPVVSRIQNLGCDGTGTHSGLTAKFETTLNKNYEKIVFDKPCLDSIINKTFRDKYGTAFLYFIITVKTCIKRILKIKIVS